MPIRLLLVDDSETMLTLLQELIGSDPDFTVVAVARSGQEAVELAKTQKPDLITMDLLMPGVDGIAAIRQLMAIQPFRIVALTSLGSGPARISFKALEAGALEVLQKPLAYASAQGQAAFRALLDRLKAFARLPLIQRSAHADESPKPLTSWRPLGIALAASTGGPPALKTLLQGLPANYSLPILIVQHISEGFDAPFVEWLNQLTALDVVLASSGQTPQPGKVYIAPDHHHLILSSSGRIQLSDAPPVNSHRPSASLLFESVAKAWKTQALGIILTGMGRDGSAGLTVLKEQGGRCLAQDQSSCQVFGMPAAAIEAGLADQVMSLDALASYLLSL